MNPCNECIVATMCHKFCDLLTDYTSTLFDDRRVGIEFNQRHSGFFAYWLRISKIDQDVGEVQIFSRVPPCRKNRTHTKRLHLTMVRGDVVNIEHNHPPIDVPMLKELNYYRRNSNYHLVFLGVKTDCGDDKEPKYYPNHSGINVRFFPRS